MSASAKLSSASTGFAVDAHDTTLLPSRESSGSDCLMSSILLLLCVEHVDFWGAEVNGGKSTQRLYATASALTMRDGILYMSDEDFWRDEGAIGCLSEEKSNLATAVAEGGAGDGCGLVHKGYVTVNS